MYHVTTDMCWNFANKNWRVCVKNALLYCDLQQSESQIMKNTLKISLKFEQIALLVVFDVEIR